MNYTRLPLTSEEIKMGISNQLFSDIDTYLKFIDNKLKYKWGDETKCIKISFSDLFIILNSIKEVFEDKEINILSYSEEQEYYKCMQDILSFYESLDDIADSFIDENDTIAVSLLDKNTLNYHIIINKKNINEDIISKFDNKNELNSGLIHFSDYAKNYRYKDSSEE